MNVIVANKYQTSLADLNIEVIKTLNGEFTVDEIINTFHNFFFQKMILDITAIKDYKDINTLQQLFISMDTSKMIVLLDDSPEVNNSKYLSNLISMGVYNFTKNIEGVKYLYENPNSYKDVAQYQNLNFSEEPETIVEQVQVPGATKVIYQEGSSARTIGFQNVTEDAGATSLIYMMKNQLSQNYNVVALEVGKHDFGCFGDKDMKSIDASNLANEISIYKDCDAVLVDLNGNKNLESLMNDVIYLIEPSKVKLGKLMMKNAMALLSLKKKKNVLNKTLINDTDMAEFEYEAGIKVYYKIPPLNDQKKNNEALNDFLSKLGFIKQEDKEDSKKGVFDIFK